MRYASLLLLLPFGLTAQAPAPRPLARSAQPSAPETKLEDLAAIEGRVSDVATGDPVRKAKLLLRRTDASLNGASTSYTTSSDNGGRFAIRDVEPGKYRLTVNRTGYADAEYGAAGPGRQGVTLSLGRAQKIGDLTLKLTPHAVVAGRVTDSDGDPLAGVMVQLLRFRYSNGRKQLSATDGNSTNDLGEYRIHGVPPGRYYVSANYRANPFEAGQDRSANPDEEFAPTYYPGTLDVSTAAEVNATAGRQLLVDFTLTKTRSVRISGRVINLAIPDARATNVMLAPRGGFIGPLLNRSTVGGSGGKFELRGVLPGSYFLIASTNLGGKSHVARQPVEIGTSNVEGVTLTIGAGFQVNGRVRVEGAPSTVANRVQVSLRPRENGINFGPAPVSTVQEDGSFTLADVNPDSYSVFFLGLPEGYYLKSARSGDTDVLTSGLDLVNGAQGTLDIVLSPNAGKASGIVLNPKTQQPMPGATVVLIPTERGRTEQEIYYKTATTDQSGSFTLTSVVPGEYKAYAWDDLERGAYFDPDFVKPFEAKGTPVSVRESSLLNLQLTLASTDLAQGGRNQ